MLKKSYLTLPQKRKFNMKLRNALFCTIPLLGLIGCSGGSSVLSTATAELQTITTALGDLAPALISALPAATQAKAKLALSSLESLNTSIQAGGLSATNAKQDILTALSAAQSLAAILPLPPTTEVATQAGIALAEAIVAGIPVSVPAPTVGVTPDTVSGPIAIPLH
jgi:hypothetical protein